MSVFSSLRLIGVIALGTLLGACSSGDIVGDTSSSSVASSSTATSVLTPTSSTVPAGTALDLSDARWVTHGPKGIRLDDGTLIWETEPFPLGIARDRQGGLVFTDSTGLWWFRAGDIEPERVGEGNAYEAVAVASTPTGPVVLTWGAGPGYYSLIDGSAVQAPPDPPVAISSQPPWVTWRADNGLSAWVTEPEVERDAEDQVSKVLEPAHLVITKDEEVLVDATIADPDQAWAAIHDFDGQRLIISRGPYEPAMPEESFLLVDLATGESTEIFRAGGTKAALVGPDSDWSGPLRAPSIETIQPPETDLSLVAVFVEFAKNPSTETFSSLPLADSVSIGLGPQIIRSVDGESLRDPEAWVIDVAEFRAYTGSFSPLDQLRSLDDYTVRVGAHSHCAGPPQAPPNEFEGLRRVSVQPGDESMDSCLDWTTVDFFVGQSGLVKAITMDLWEP